MSRIPNPSRRLHLLTRTARRHFSNSISRMMQKYSVTTNSSPGRDNRRAMVANVLGVTLTHIKDAFLQGAGRVFDNSRVSIPGDHTEARAVFLNCLLANKNIIDPESPIAHLIEECARNILLINSDDPGSCAVITYHYIIAATQLGEEYGATHLLPPIIRFPIGLVNELAGSDEQ